MSAVKKEKKNKKPKVTQTKYHKIIRISLAAHSALTGKAAYHEAVGHVVDRLLGIEV